MVRCFASKSIARRFPKLVVGFRAVGEEFHDVWLRNYSGETVVFSAAPLIRKRPIDPPTQINSKGRGGHPVG